MPLEISNFLVWPLKAIVTFQDKPIVLTFLGRKGQSGIAENVKAPRCPCVAAVAVGCSRHKWQGHATERPGAALKAVTQLFRL